MNTHLKINYFHDFKLEINYLGPLFMATINFAEPLNAMDWIILSTSFYVLPSQRRKLTLTEKADVHSTSEVKSLSDMLQGMESSVQINANYQLSGANEWFLQCKYSTAYILVVFLLPIYCDLNNLSLILMSCCPTIAPPERIHLYIDVPELVLCYFWYVTNVFSMNFQMDWPRDQVHCFASS